ncbi:MAG: phenylalanine--tRNA ligase subunit alpha [Candidatus Paceibacterota bacterium]|jgi:phenylalanyl-tRNA synthetase alpha chain
MENDKKGHLHPITQIVREIFSIFRDLGFEIADGPELEDEFHNFDALNVPKDHPARDMQDTFWIKDAPDADKKRVLRTHTSSVQIRYMEKHKPPVRIIIPGKVFRNEATDATHEAQFFQIEALYVDKNVSMAHLKGTLENMFKKLFGDDVEIRFRPSFFPFTEPSVEVDMKWKGKWLEMGGAGLVQKNVFEAVGVDPNEWQGFAFGFGLDRLVMLKFGIDDVRFLYNGDLRLVNQF